MRSPLRRQSRVLVGGFTAVCLAITACSNDSPLDKQADPGGATTVAGGPVDSVFDTLPGGPRKQWTVMVYMAGDNNLEQDAIDDLREMQAGAADHVNLIAMLDRSPGFSTDALEPFGDWVGTKAMSITPTGIVDLGLTGDADMTSPAVLEGFVAQVVAAYPAEHTALVLWDHAGGWRGYADEESNPGSSLSSAEVVAAVSAGLASAGVSKLDIISYDACLMADSEVVFAMASVADVLIASQELVPSHGLNYEVIGNATAADAENFGSVMLGGFASEARDDGGADAITMSMIDLQQVTALDQAIGQLAAAMANIGGDEAAAFLRAANESLAFAYSDDPSANAHMRDLGQLLSRFSSQDPAITAAQQAVDAALSAAVLLHIEGAAFAGARGISVYIPTSIEYFATAYNDSPTAASWSAVLDTVYNAGADAVVALDSAFVIPPEGLFDSTGVSVVAAVDPALVPSLVEITMVYGLDVGDGTFLVLGAAPGTVVDAAQGIVGGTIGLLRYELSVDGFTNSLLSYYSLVPNPEDPAVAIFTTQMFYFAPGAEDQPILLTLRVAVEIATDTVVDKAMYVTEESGTVAEFTPDPAGTLQAIVPLVNVDGSITPVNSAQFDDPPSIPTRLDLLDVGFQLILPGDGTVLSQSPIAAGLRIVDSGGTVTFAMVAVPTEL